MSQTQIAYCTHCGASYQLPVEYVAQYGGQETQCRQCNRPFPIPLATAAQAPGGPAPVLAYMGPTVVQAPIGIWREGMQVVAVNGAVFPPRCVKCNEPGDGRPMLRKLYWHSPWVYLTILAGLLIFVIVALCVRKTGMVQVCLCSRHRARRTRFVIGAWLGFATSIAMFLAAADSIIPEVMLSAGIVLLLASIIAGFAGSRIVAPARIDGNYLWLKGAGLEFLATLPDAR